MHCTNYEELVIDPSWLLDGLVESMKYFPSLSSPPTLLQALAGCELLLSKAQLWEETAASHVTLAGRQRQAGEESAGG